MQPKPSNPVETPVRKPSNAPLNQGHESEIKQWMLKKCQRSHLSADLFPLQSILIPPKLLARIQTPGPDDAQQYVPVLWQTLPRLFEVPELLSGMPYPTISLEKALSSSGKVVISGYAGSGKTTALADLAERICMKDSSVSSFAGSLPIFIHCRDLMLSVPARGDFLYPLAHSVALLLKHHEEKPIYDSISTAVEQGNLILLIDGLEEVLPDFALQVEHWIKNLLHIHPNIKIVTTAVPNYCGILGELGFLELSLAPWSTSEKQEFLSKFNAAWMTCFKQSEGSSFIPLWLRTAKLPSTPIEMTLFCWSAFTGNRFKMDGPTIFGPYLTHLTPHPLSLDTLVEIASKQIANGFAGLTQFDLENIITKDPILARDNPDNLRRSVITESQNGDGVQEPLTSKDVITEMLQAGLLSQSLSGRISFTNSHLCAALYTQNPLLKLPNSWRPALQSSLIDSMMVFACAGGKLNAQITQWLEEFDVPLFRNFLLISHWLTAFPQANKSNLLLLFRKLIPLIQKDRLPISLQIHLTEAFLLAEQPSTFTLFKDLAASPNVSHRQVAAFGLSSFSSHDSEQILISLSTDTSNDVQKLACVSLARLWSRASQKQLVNLVISASPEIRQIICELFAFLPSDGHELLKELSVLVDNPETRKASVYGLFLVGADWSKALIKKINIDDTEWLVRDAASHTIKISSLDYLVIPGHKPKVSDLPWLIKFAARKRLGIHADEFPV
ncbi:NACHT domain-containing protein, partial [bacterium]|nr:NACHT domain-containing protein [bacterium]